MVKIDNPKNHYETINFDRETGEIKGPRPVVYIRSREDGSSKPVDQPIQDALVQAEWSDDPRTGKAVLTEDGREVINPVPLAPPIGYTPEKSLMEMVSEMLDRRLATLNGQEEIDTLEEAEDYGEDEEPIPWSPYEVHLVDEYPAIPPEKKTEDPSPDAPPSSSSKPGGNGSPDP